MEEEEELEMEMPEEEIHRFVIIMIIMVIMRKMVITLISKNLRRRFTGS